MLEKLNSIEKNVIFNFTRIIALIMILGIFVLLVLGVVGFVNMKGNTYISYSEVKTVLNEDNKSSSNSSRSNSSQAKETLDSVAPKINISQNIKGYFTNDNREILINWLKDMNAQQQKKFISNLENIINKAQSDESIQVYKAINKYKNLKFNKFNQVSNNPFSNYEDTFRKVGILLFIIMGIGLIGLFSLVLVLLAIERNTRQ